MKLARPYRKWTPERAARAGFLAGRGYTSKQIFDDDLLGAVSPKAIENVLSAWRIPLNKGRGGKAVFCSLSPSETARLEAAAKARSIPLEELAEAILSIVASDAALIDNVMDDEVD